MILNCLSLYKAAIVMHKFRLEKKQEVLISIKLTFTQIVNVLLKNFWPCWEFSKIMLDEWTSSVCFGDKNAGRGDRVAEAWRRSSRHGDDFVWLGGHSA